ncbi:MAG: 23S rRNA pseudouridine(955/2504/2580) synthase RluC [Gammaproteobacteria bacterium]|nr:23S rRNA pseudouridine(955/2504/2580) synthase RluC [Gammaproteobacteria bacterium]
MSESEQKKTAVQILAVGAESDGQRIDNFLIGHLKGVPRSYIYRIIRRGEVRVNKGRKSASYRVRQGDLVRVPPVRQGEREVPGQPSRQLLERVRAAVVQRDDRVLVLNKPSGLAVHGGSGINLGVIEVVRALYPQERQLELVHRLDRDTSGILLISRRRSALRSLHQLIRENRMEKRYLALVAGSWSADRLEVDQPLLKNTLQGGERVVKVDSRGKSALTRFRVLKRYEDCMLVEAELITGRTHQIRVHAAYLGTPILGDCKYGDDEANRRMRELGLKRLFLHAESIAFSWPQEIGGGMFQVSAPLDHELNQTLERLQQGIRSEVVHT